MPKTDEDTAHLAALTPLVSTAVSAYRGLGPGLDDLLQEAWLTALTAAAAHDHGDYPCSRESFVVNSIKRRLSRFCLLTRLRRTGPLPAYLRSRLLTPLEQAIFNERLNEEAV